MRTETRTVRVGEYLGPVDWDYDFEEHGWDRTGAFNPELIPGRVEMLRKLAENPDGYEATTDGGWPRVGWGRVGRVGMYDGWPYWKPTPSVWIESHLGGSWHSWLSVSDIRPTKERL